MRPVLTITLAILLTLSPLRASADVSFADLARLASSPDQLEGRFRQEKYLAELDTLLLSSGRFSYHRDATIRWEILEPIRNELVITPAGLSSRQGDNELLRIDANSNPGAALLGEIMFAVLSAEWSRLEQYFELSGEIDGPQWRAMLQPRDAAIGQIINQVELRGAELLRVIVLHERGGDSTTIYLDVPEG